MFSPIFESSKIVVTMKSVCIIMIFVGTGVRGLSTSKRPSGGVVMRFGISSQEASSLQDWSRLGKKKIDFGVLRSRENDNADDDGWGVTKDDSSEKEKELESLRAQISEKRNAPSISPSPSQELADNERDLFIPIFALVSLLGLFGAYGYEMLRLYSRGELYLPGM